ncbi:MAG TPA: hypothetical protein DEQ09_03415 [Bacteroidales bacterium]|nr:hypothetical protein [Bacteroidales bacterium]
MHVPGSLIQTKTVFEVIEELYLPDNKDQDILRDDIIRLTSPSAIKKGISSQKLRLVHVYKEDENKVIEIITNQLDWKARTIADLYKKRWDIELFFKALKPTYFLLFSTSSPAIWRLQTILC